MSQLLKRLEEAFCQQIPFSKLIDLKIESIMPSEAILSFAMTPTLVGNILNGSLHGGVTATVFDSVGGLLTMASIFFNDKTISEDEYFAKLAKTSTVNLNINYLSPGTGNHFTVRAQPLKVGRSLIRTKMVLHNENDLLIAESTGTYLIPA